MKSPLRYPGGKTRACKTLLDIVDREGLDTSEVVSPFTGGASFEFYLRETRGARLVLNDKFTPLATFWTACKHDKDRLCAVLEDARAKGVTKDDFKRMRDTIMDEADTLERAKKYFVINRCSFSGSTLSGGFSEESSKKRFTKSSIDRVRALNLSDVAIHEDDFASFLNVHGKGRKGFVFVDPPYYLESKSKLYGKNGDLHENFDHSGLREALDRVERDWVLTYNDTPYIRELYKDHRIVDVSWTYGMNSSKASSEIVILSSSRECTGDALFPPSCEAIE
jgi:DNA adenine methylase